MMLYADLRGNSIEFVNVCFTIIKLLKYVASCELLVNTSNFVFMC